MQTIIPMKLFVFCALFCLTVILQAKLVILSDVLTVKTNKTSINAAGIARQNTRIESPGVLACNFSSGENNGISVNLAKCKSKFIDGSIAVSFCYPKGKMPSCTFLLLRNAGGANPGDAYVLLYGTQLIALGKDIGVDGASFKKVINIAGKISEGTWNDFVLNWNKEEGTNMYLNGALIYSNRKLHGPFFSTANVPLMIGVKGNLKSVGTILISNALLTDTTLNMDEIKKRYQMLKKVENKK